MQGAGIEHPEKRSPVSVVVVDDDVDMRELLAVYLERSGEFQVVAFGDDGEDAIRLASEHEPDVVVLDLMMPRVGGREALPRIVAEVPRTMVVVVSGLEPELEERPALSAGAFAFLEKDQIDGDLPARIADLLADFRLALSGETVVAPSSRRRVHSG